MKNKGKKEGWWEDRSQGRQGENIERRRDGRRVEGRRLEMKDKAIELLKENKGWKRKGKGRVRRGMRRKSGGRKLDRGGLKRLK